MSDLFQTTNEISRKFFSNPAFKKQSINDIAIARLIDMASLVTKEQELEARAHTEIMNNLKRKVDSINYASFIASGHPGFLRCSQGWADLQSEFTTFPEIVGRIMEPMVDVSIAPMNVFLGMELWSIDDRGMMTLIDAVRDSSD